MDIKKYDHYNPTKGLDLYISKSRGRYNFHNGSKVLHSLDVRHTPSDRLAAHWEGFVMNSERT